MTRDEIEQFLEDWDIAPIRNNIDMIEERLVMSRHQIEELLTALGAEASEKNIFMIRTVYDEGYTIGEQRGFESGRELEDKIDRLSFEIATKQIFGDEWEWRIEHHNIDRPRGWMANGNSR